MIRWALLGKALLFCGITVQAQSYVLISRFDWDSNPVTTAVVGPNANSVSSSAGSSPGGVGGTNGLNAKATGSTQDINLTITGSPTFDVHGIDIWIDFQREESESGFYRRTGFNFGMTGGSISVSFRVSDGSGSYITVASGGVYTVPNDDVFRTYRFFYNPVNGMAGIHVNGTAVWTYDGTDNRNMYWTSAGNVVVGAVTDGTGANETIMDNLRVYAVINSPLPVELLDFKAIAHQQAIELKWETASETQNLFFTVERSANGILFESAGKRDGYGTTNEHNYYMFTDEDPYEGISYYRLKQTDIDGTENFSNTIVVELNESGPTLSVSPNPCNGSFLQVALPWSQGELVAEVYDLSGKLIDSQYLGVTVSKNQSLYWTDVLPKGIYQLLLRNGSKTALAKIVVQ